MEVYIIDYDKHMKLGDKRKVQAEDLSREGDYLGAKARYEQAAKEYAQAVDAAWGAGDKTRTTVAEAYSALCESMATEMIYRDVDAHTEICD